MKSNRLVAATCALDAQIKLWDIESGKLIRDIDATPGKSLSSTRLAISLRTVLVNAWSLAFSPDGQYIATGSFGGKVDLYNSQSGQKEMTLDTQTKFVLSAIYVRTRTF